MLEHTAFAPQAGSQGVLHRTPSSAQDRHRLAPSGVTCAGVQPTALLQDPKEPMAPLREMACVKRIPALAVPRQPATHVRAVEAGNSLAPNRKRSHTASAAVDEMHEARSANRRNRGGGPLPDSPEPRGFHIFLNYRRDDAPDAADRLRDALLGVGREEGFAEDQVFMDIDTIEPGVDFREVIRTAVGSCDVFIAVIGRQWLNVVDAKGRRRLDNPADFVRLEIEAALGREDLIYIVPVRVQGAEMPSPEELPDGLQDFAHRNAIKLSRESWPFDVGRLISWLKELERRKQEETTAEGDAAEPAGREQADRDPAQLETAHTAERVAPAESEPLPTGAQSQAVPGAPLTGQHEYDALAIQLRPSGNGAYQVLASGPMGEAVSEFRFPFQAFELENFALRIGTAHRGTR